MEPQAPIIISKAPSAWRRGESADSVMYPRHPNSNNKVSRNGHELNSSQNSRQRYGVENPHTKPRISYDRPHSHSINRTVYPDWWGCDQVQDQENQYRQNRQREIKRLKSADVHKAKINKNIARHCEDSLDKRLREVHEGVHY